MNLKKTEEELAACEKYQRILDAAVEVIAERGYFHSPVSEIAKRAGVADGTVYLYFKSKDDVLRTAIDTTFAKFYSQIADAFVTLKGPREQLEYIAQVHLESCTVNRSMAVLMQTEMRQSAKFIAEFSHHHLVKYIQVVREVVRRGRRRESSGRMSPMAWWRTVCLGRLMNCSARRSLPDGSMMRRLRRPRCSMCC